MPRSDFPTDSDGALAIAGEFGFVCIVTGSGPSALTTHVPLIFDSERKDVLLGHFACSNPQFDHLRTGGEGSVLLIFSGPHCYISPRFYQTPRNISVPTWNYVSAYAKCTPTIIDDEAGKLRILAALSDKHESGAKNPWKVWETRSDYRQKMLALIVAFELKIETISGIRKLSQNKSPAGESFFF